MKRVALMFVICLFVCGAAFATGEITLIDGGNLKYRIDAGEFSGSSCWVTTSSGWTPTTTICIPTTSSYSCWTSGTTTYSTWTTCTGTTFTGAFGAASEASYSQSVSASTVGGGFTPMVLGDAFDTYNYVSLRRNAIDIDFKVTDSPTVEDNGRQIYFPTQTINYLEITRKVFVPENDEFCRWLNIVTNTGDAPEVVVMNIRGNLGSDSGTVLIDSSSGDTAATVSDLWVVSMEQFSGSISYDPRLGHVLQGADAPAPVSLIEFNNGSDNTFWRYEFTLEPGETGIVMNFVTGQPTIAAARQKAIELSDPNGHALDYMTPDEKATVVNFVLTPYRTLTVNSLEDNVTPDDGLVTLREAILAANSAGFTDLGQLAGAYNLLDLTGLTGTIALTGPLPTIDSDMIIEGSDPDAKTVVTGVTISGGDLYRIMDLNGAHLTLKNLTLQDGLAEGGNGANTDGGGGGGGAMGAGGAVFVSGGSFKAIGVTFNHNGAVGGDGGDGDDTANAHTQGGGGGGMGGDGHEYTGGDGGVLRGTGGISDGANADGPGAGAAGNDAFGAGGVGGYGGGGGGGGSTDFSKVAIVGGGAGGTGGFAGGGGGAGGANADAPGTGGAGGTYGGAGGGSVTGVAYGGGGGGGAGLGGALYVIGCNISVEGCTFSSNYAHNGLGGSGASPGGNGEGYGGAIFLDYGDRFWESGNTFVDNEASTDEDDIHGEEETVPAVLAISLLDDLLLTGDSARFLVIFSSDVTGVDVSDFSIETTGSVSADIALIEGEGDRYVVTLALGPSEGEVGIRVLDDDTILDGGLAPLGGVGLANGEYSSDTYTVDNIHPNPPLLSVEELPDKFFTWTWESGGGGNGTFRWRLNESQWTETTDLSYTTPDSADYGPLLFEVQERDDAGNWSESSSVDTIVVQRLYVDGEGADIEPRKSGDGSGSSWENATATIGHALMSAETNYVEIWVKSGLYVESNRLYGGERLYGGFAGTESTLEERDLSGPPTIVTGSYGRAFTIETGYFPNKDKGESPVGTVIDGFTLASSSADYSEAKQPEGDVGGALFFSGYGGDTDKSLLPNGDTPDPHRVANCVFSGNAAFLGGAIFIEFEYVEIENCIFSGNLSVAGGAIFSEIATFTCTNSTFSGNAAFEVGSAIFSAGAYNLTNCIFEGNRIECAIYSEPERTKIDLTPERIVRNCLFNNNCYADICIGGYFMQSYTGADEINGMPGASNNVDGDPLFAAFGPAMLGGPVDSADYDYFDRIVTITDADASFEPGALMGRLLWLAPPVGEGEGEGEPLKLAVEGEGEGEGEGECATEPFMCLVILDNTETTIAALLQRSERPPAKELVALDYLVLDYQLLPGSPAIDTGTDEGAPVADIVGGLRPIDIWGTGAEDTGTEWDIGAYEADFLHVVSITRADPSPTNAQQVAFNVLFSAPVEGVGAEDFELAATGTLADFGVDLVSTLDNMLYVVTVDTGDGDGTLRLDAIDDDSIVDEDGRFLGGEGEGNGDFDRGEEYVIDKTLPEPLNLAATPRLAKLGTEVTITFDVSEPVVTTAVTVNGHVATQAAAKNGLPAYTYTYAIQESDPDGCANIVVDLQDAAGNDSSTPVCDTAVLEVDQTPPEFTNIVAVPALAKEGAVVEIAFTASEPLDGDPQVTVNGHPAIMDKADGDYWFIYTVLSSDPDGPAEIVITGQDIVGNPGQTTNNDALTIDKTPPVFGNIDAVPGLAKEGAVVEITFTASEPLDGEPLVTVNGHLAIMDKADGDYWFLYTVSSSDPEGPAEIVITGQDLAGNPGMATNNEALTVDKTPPEFIGIIAQPPLAKEGGIVQIVFTATEPLDGDPLVTVNGHPATMSAGKGVGYLFIYTVQANDPDGPAEIVVTGQDLAGNSGQATDNEALTIDSTPPEFTGIVANPALADAGRVVTIAFTASETLQGVPDVMVNGYPAIQSFSKALDYQFTYTVQAGTPDGPATIVISGMDLAGNAGETTNTDALTIDQTPPAFTAIVADPAAAERGSTVALAFTASESLRFNPTVTVNGHPAAFVSSNGLDYTYSYSVWMAEAFGPAEIVIVGQDIAGNVGTTVNTTALTIVDLVAPTVGIGAPSVGATRGGPVTFLITYSDDVAGISLSLDDIELIGAGATGDVALSDSGAFARLVTISGITGDGTLGIAIPAGTAADEFGNPAPAADSDLFDVDNTGPVIDVLGENPVTVALNSEYADAGATALDARDGDLTESIETVNDVDTSIEGVYTVTYDVADSLGNAAVQQVRTVYVRPLDECGAFAFPVDGSTITVAGGPDFWLVPILEADIEGAARLEFFLDGVSIGEVEAPPYSISYAMTATETPVQYELTAQAYDAQDNVLCSSTTTFNVIIAAQGEDGDGNGLPDNPFTALPDLGNTWFSQNVSGETGGTVVTAAANLNTCDAPPVPVVVTLIDLEQRVTATAPAELFQECEMAIVVFQMAPDLDTLLGSVEAAVVLPEPDDVLLLGGMYYLCTVLVSNDEGATFDEIDPARLAANPVSLEIEGVAVPGDAVFYTHDIFAGSDPLTGVFIGGVAGPWDTTGLANVNLFPTAVSVDVVKPTLFAPYSIKADDNPPLWPWLALLAAALGISLAAGGGDDDGGGGPCFIATAAYGTPLADDIDVLRNVRDRYLLGTAAGTALVDAYYRMSPGIADAVGVSPALAAAVRVALLPVVALSRALLIAPGAVVLVAIALVLLAFRRRGKARRTA